MVKRTTCPDCATQELAYELQVLRQLSVTDVRAAAYTMAANVTSMKVAAMLVTLANRLTARLTATTPPMHKALMRLLDEFEEHFGTQGDIGLIEVRRWLETRHVHWTPASEPHTIGTVAPNDENDPAGRYPRA